MAKHSSHKKRTHSRKVRSMHRSQKGGELAGNPASAWGWGMGTLGDGWRQFTDVFTLQPGQNFGTNQSNDIVPVGSVNSQSNMPQLGGKTHKRRRHHRRSAKRGGNVLAQAAVPAALMAIGYGIGRRSRSRRHNRSHRHKHH